MNLFNSLFRSSSYVPPLRAWETDISEIPDPDYIVIPLEYPGQILYKPTVKINDQVHKYQIIARSDRGNCLHASISGIVKDIKPIWTARSYHVPAVLIHREELPPFTTEDIFRQYGIPFKDATWVERMKALGVINPWTRPGRFHQEQDIEEFPSIKHVVIKGVNEEPSIFVLRLLLEKKQSAVIAGIKQIREVLPQANIWLTVPEQLPQEVWKNFSRLVDVVALPDQYKQRIERAVVPRITGVDIPNIEPYRQRGVAVISVEYLLCMQECLSKGIPFIHKYLTVAGTGIKKPITVRYPIGISIRTVLNACGIEPGMYSRLLVGGPMKGIAQYNDLTPLTKTSHGIYLLDGVEIPTEQNLTCLNCGRCVAACPVNLQVQMIGRYVEFGLFEEVARYHPEACNECGLCAYVCPAQRPLVQLIRLSNKYHQRANEQVQPTECSIESPLEGWEQDIWNSATMAAGAAANRDSQPEQIRN